MTEENWRIRENKFAADQEDLTHNHFIRDHHLRVMISPYH